MKIRTIRRSMIGSLMTLLLLGTGLTFHYSSALGASGPPINSLSSPSHPDQNVWYSNSSPFFSWTSSSTTFSYDFDQNPSTIPDDVAEPYATSISYPGIADGTWYFHVKAYFPMVGWGDTAHIRVQIDTTGPTVTDLASPTHPDENTAYANHSPSFSWNSSTVGLLGTCCSSYQGGLGVAVSGNYAYVADGINGLKIIDISNPANPRGVGSLNTPGSGLGVAVSGNYAYVADGGSGLRIINVSNPSSPQEVGSWATGSRMSKNVAISGRYAYVADGSNGLQIIDVNDPANPVLHGSINPGSVSSVAISGDYAYLARYSSGFQIVDISDPANPQLKGSVSAYSNGSVGVAVAGNYAYVADTANGLMVIDVTSKTSPLRVGSLKPPGTAYSVALSGNYAYLTDGTAGLHVIDISTPSSPVLKGTYDTPYTASGVAVNGNYAYVADNYSYGGGGELQVLRFTPSSFSYVLDQNPGTDPNTTIDGTSLAASYTGIADGTWYFHIKGTDDLGNWGAPVHRKIQIFSDSIAPTTILPPGWDPNVWHTAAFNIDLTCTDNPGGSGCYRTFYNLFGTWHVGTMVPIVNEGDNTIEFYSTDIAGNTETSHTFTQAKLDTIAPAITNIVPTGSVSGSHQTIEADLADGYGSSGVNAESASVSLDGGAALIGCTKLVTHISCPANDLSGGSHSISVSVDDVAGNTGSSSGSFIIEGRDYFWTWYDNIGGDNWVLMANPDSATQTLTFNLSIGAGPPMGLTNFNNGIVTPGASITPIFSGVRNGPVKAVSTTGDKGITSQRILWPKGGNSLEEVPGIEADRLSDHYYWTWYDQKSPGFTNWILIANPSETETVHAVISFTNLADGLPVSLSADIAPGNNWTPTFPGKMGGPVEVKASLKNNTWPTEARVVIASQRVLSNYGTAFNEVPGTPAGELSNSYLWTWYDQNSPGYTDWVLIANPNDTEVTYQIKIGGVTQPCGACTIAAHDKVTPTFPGQINGPVEVTSTGGNVIASQRIVAGPSFEEVPGYPQSALTNDYHWTWYDQKSSGVTNWVLVANPNDTQVYYEITLSGQALGQGSKGTIEPGKNVTPTFPGKMAGPLEVKAWTDQTKTSPANIMVSQRVTWNGYFNEVLGTVLS